MIAEVVSIRDALAAAAARLGGSEAMLEAELLLAHALDKDRAWLYAHSGEPCAASVSAAFDALVARRASGEPLAYILGRREFWSLELAVTPDVLIPRPETELLVELALERIPQAGETEIADLGTGSGAIALALARERPLARVLATDSSAAALGVARANAQRLGIRNVSFALGDWFAATGPRRFDMIVSNPPYVASADPHLERGDLRFEPRAALAAGRDGLKSIRVIARAAASHLRPRGWLLLEHGLGQGHAVRALLEGGGLVEVFTASDLEHRERVSGGRLAQ